MYFASYGKQTAGLSPDVPMVKACLRVLWRGQPVTEPCIAPALPA
jgi:hypothetical protein